MADTNDTGAAAPEQTPLQSAIGNWQDSVELAADGFYAMQDIFKAIKSLSKDSNNLKTIRDLARQGLKTVSEVQTKIGASQLNAEEMCAEVLNATETNYLTSDRGPYGAYNFVTAHNLSKLFRWTNALIGDYDATYRQIVEAAKPPSLPDWERAVNYVRQGLIVEQAFIKSCDQIATAHTSLKPIQAISRKPIAV